MSKIYASAAYDADNPTRIDAIDTQGHVKRLCSTIELPASAAGTVVDFGQLPPGARISSLSKLHADAIAGNTAFNLGLYTPDGKALDADCLMAAVDVHAGGNFDAAAAVDAAKLATPLFSLSGQDAASGALHVCGTLGALTTAAGTLTLELFYITH